VADDVAERLKKRRGSGWTKEQVRSLSNEAILARLAGFGVGTSTSQFVQLARVEQSADVVAQDWRRRLEVSARGSDDDFIEIAACVLWERLLPERPSFEMLDERMQAGYTALRANDFVRACDLWLDVWEGFKLHLTPGMVRVRDVDTVFHGAEFFINWCQEFEQELGNAGAHDARYLRARVRYVNELMHQFSAEDDHVLVGNCLRAEAEALWGLGEPVAAEEHYEALIRRYPNFAWGYIGLADCFWLGPDPVPQPKEFARAEAVYQRALAVPTLEERADVLERLADLYLERGDPDDEVAVVRRQADAERRRSLGPLIPESLFHLPSVTPSMTAGATHSKLGRNERCWCGSGLKYKRCHVDADRGQPRS
jgi:tetratricopeptide (TPR) repeat protein